MKMLNKLLTIPALMLLLTFITGCNNGDIVAELENLQSMFILFDYEYSTIDKTVSFTVDGDVEVDWGDGTLSKATTHTYNDYSNYIRIMGNIKDIKLVYDGVNDNYIMDTLIFPSTITTIASNSIVLPNLSLVYLPKSISKIEDYAFTSSSEIEFYAETNSKPEGWSEHWAHIDSFKDSVCYGTHIGYGDGNLSICVDDGSYAILLYCSSRSETLFIPDVMKLNGKSYQTEYLGDYTSFSYMCRTLVLPKYLTEIPANCFYEFEQEKIDLSRIVNLICINEFAFAHSYIKELYIPKTVQFIGVSIASGSIYLEKITVDPDNPYFHSPENSNVIMRGTKLIAGCPASFIPEETTVIAHYAFDNVDNLKEIAIPKNVRELEYASFWFCSDLKAIDMTAFTNKDDIPNCHKTAFSEDPRLETVYRDASLTKEDFVNKGWPSRLNYITKEIL